jgi:hypothetical protein
MLLLLINSLDVIVHKIYFNGVTMLQKFLLATLMFLGLSISSLHAMDLSKAAAMIPGQSAPQAPATKAVGGSDLTSLITSQLGVTDKQATGGLGSMLGYAKSALKPNEFSKVSDSIPGIDSLLGAAPSLGGGLGAAAGALGGDSLSGLAAVASQFSSLGLNADMIQKFAPILLNYVKGTGGSDVMGLLAGLF